MERRLSVWLGLTALALIGAGSIACSEGPARAQQATPKAGTDTRASLRVRVAAVERAPLDHEAEVSGVVSPFRSATVAAEVAGRVVSRHVEPGAVVEEGDVLVAVDATQLAVAVAEAEATLSARDVDLAEARRELERADELFKEGALSESRHEALRFGVDRAESARRMAAASLRRARRSHSDASIRAPFAGTIESVAVHTGDYLAPGVPVARVADFEQVRVRAGVTATEASSLRAGADASLSVTALGGRSFAARVHSVGRTADSGTGTYPVELWLDNPDGALRAGMVARVLLPSDDAEAVLCVPRSALVRRGGTLAVFVVEGSEGALDARVREVRVGRQGGESVELLEGVEAGERVVIEGQFALSDGAPVVIDEARAPGA
ncbi:MAG: efflux RND transporter periplasmic adaptor subunit [Myxococcota bacterium]|nr:efflux RND transporter periplasmic adaptor subunit [Myxococcota bacterium]